MSQETRKCKEEIKDRDKLNKTTCSLGRQIWQAINFWLMPLHPKKSLHDSSFWAKPVKKLVHNSWGLHLSFSHRFSRRNNYLHLVMMILTDPRKGIWIVPGVSHENRNENRFTEPTRSIWLSVYRAK